MLTLTKRAAPTTPATNKSSIYVDTSDRRAKQIDDNGVISNLNNNGVTGANRLTNGSFIIQQRVAVASTAIPLVSTTTRAGRVADRWAVTTGNATTTSWQQVDTMAAVETGLETRFYGKITQATNAAKFILSQFLEANDISNLRGKKVRISVKLKQFVGSTQVYKLGLLQLTAAGTVDTCPAFTTAIGASGVAPTWGTNLAAIAPDASPTGENGTVNGSWLEITNTTGWIKSSCVVTIPTDCKNLCFVLWKDATGGATDAVGVAEFQMTEGTEIVDFERLSFQTEYLKCLRYFCKTFAYGTVPVQSAGVATGPLMAPILVVGTGALAATFFWRFPLRMRITPTVTTFSPAAASVEAYNITQAVVHTATTAVAQLDDSVCYTSTGGTAGAIGQRAGLHITADAEFVT
jgi:hypothetical protein